MPLLWDDLPSDTDKVRRIKAEPAKRESFLLRLLGLVLPRDSGISRRLRRRILEYQASRLRFLHFPIIFLLFGCLVYGVIYWRGEFVWQSVRHYAMDWASDAGMRVDEVTVSGHQFVSLDDLESVWFSSRGTSLLFLDIADLQERLESLGWVRSATVTRIFPNRLHIEISEEVAVAVWQVGGEHFLINSDGDVISNFVPLRLYDLLLVVGAGGNRRLGDLWSILSEVPHLLDSVRAAGWVGERRWNIYLDGMKVQLPQFAADEAWRYFGEVAVNEDILERGITLVDMRNSDRIIIRLPESDSDVPVED